MQLKGGVITQDRRLDRVYQEDWRSLDYPVTAVLEPELPLRSYTWSCKIYNDQGQEGACVGFGWGHELCASPKVIPTDADGSRAIYHAAQEVDEWPGHDYEGSSVLAGAKVIQSMGHMDEYVWGLTLEQWVSGVGKSPCVIGINWHHKMLRTDAEGFIYAEGSVVGGHCILCRGVKLVFVKGKPKTFENLDLDKSYFLLHNSWGPEWGLNGTAKLPLRSAEILLAAKADVCFPVRRH